LQALKQQHGDVNISMFTTSRAGSRVRGGQLVARGHEVFGQEAWESGSSGTWKFESSGSKGGEEIKGMGGRHRVAMHGADGTRGACVLENRQCLDLGGESELQVQQMSGKNAH